MVQRGLARSEVDHRREPVELAEEDDDEERRDDELGQRVDGQCGQREPVVDRAARVDAGEHAERQSERQEQRERDAREDRAVAHRLPDP